MFLKWRDFRIQIGKNYWDLETCRKFRKKKNYFTEEGSIAEGIFNFLECSKNVQNYRP